MKFIPASERTSYKVTDSVVSYEYVLSEELNAAPIEISGRYPAVGWALNTACTSLVHILKGNGVVTFEGSAVAVSQNDQLLIEMGEKYAFEGNDLEILYIATPAWTPEQAQNPQ
jgi:mannose-6-phosphate isomerase-like protein (cupin superfamily)